MKPVIGLLLILLGLTIGYLTLAGKLPATTGGGPGPLAPDQTVTHSRNFSTRSFQYGESYR